jgi:hypothetical protein
LRGCFFEAWWCACKEEVGDRKGAQGDDVGESVVFVVVLPPQCGCWREVGVARRRCPSGASEMSRVETGRHRLHHKAYQ